MTKFTNGPAAGKVLELLRMPMPLFLRVTKAQDGTIDALDQLDDTPRDDEELFLYRKARDDGTVHVDGRDKKGKRFGKWYNCCTYTLHETQPDQATMRDGALWPAWCKAEFARLKGSVPNA